MGTPTPSVPRDRLAVAIGTVLLAGGLLGLWLPVFLGDYDTYGIQVRCGNGYSGLSLRETVEGQQASDGAAPVGFAGQCRGALAHRRAWSIPTAGLGVLTLTFAAVAQLRRRAGAPDSAGSAGAWSEAPDDYWHETASLDRRGRPHRERPPGTTL